MHKNLLGRISFGIMYVVSAKSQSVSGTSHQPAFIDSCVTISHTRLPCLPGR